jgi:hypothetical protein
MELLTQEPAPPTDLINKPVSTLDTQMFSPIQPYPPTHSRFHNYISSFSTPQATTDLPTLHALPHLPYTQPALQAQQPPKGQLRGQRKNHPTTATHVPSVSMHGPKISESYQAKFLHQKDLLRMLDHLKLTTLKSQNATSPADPVEAPSKPIPKPTPEQRSNTKGSSLELCQFPVFFQFFRAVF